MTVHILAVALAAAVLVYHQVTTWVPLFPWNDVAKYSRKELLIEAGINGLTMSIGVACLVLGTSGFFRWYPVIYFPLLLIGECFSWWIPYFRNKASDPNSLFEYDSHFGRTIKLIPHKPLYQATQNIKSAPRE